MTQMTEAKVKDILRNHDGILRGIRKKIFQLYMEMENNTGVESLVLSSNGSNEAGICLNKKGGIPKDLADFILKGEIVVHNRRAELAKMMWRLTEDEQDINRVWACYLSLPATYYDILTAVYVENKKWNAVELEFGHAHSYFAKRLKDGLQEIINVYNSGLTIADIMVKRERYNK